MADSLKSILKKIGGFFQNLEKKKLIMLVVIAVVVVGAGVIGTILLNRINYTVLYSGLDASEAGKIKTVLDGKSVKSQVRGTDTILVPEEQADDLRIELASEGYPSTGLNYDIFAKSSALGSTDLERRTYLQYQLQENMRATISRMEKVKDCVVIVNLATSSSYVVDKNTSEASVAVMLDLKSGQTLSQEEARSISEFIKKCVPDLKTENISIVDSKMNYYDISNDNGTTATQVYTVTQMQLTEQMKQALVKQAMSIVEPAVGSGNVAVSVNLNLNFDKQTVNKVEFKPPVDGESQGMLRSSEELAEAVGGTTTTAQAPGTDTNGVGTPAYVAGGTTNPNGETKTSKTYNYELNQIQTQIEKAQGSIENLSVAVLVNSDVEGIDSNATMIKNLVAKAIGVKPDYISVEMMPFKTDNAISDAFKENQQAIEQVSRNNLISRIVTVVAVMAILIVILWFFVRKPTRRVEMAAIGVGGELGLGSGVGLTPGDFIQEQEEDEFDLSSLVLKKSSETEKIEELMDRYPETVAQILRTWIAEDD